MDKHNLEIAIKTANMYQFFFGVMLCNLKPNKENKQKPPLPLPFERNVEVASCNFSSYFATSKCLLPLTYCYLNYFLY